MSTHLVGSFGCSAQSPLVVPAELFVSNEGSRSASLAILDLSVRRNVDRMRLDKEDEDELRVMGDTDSDMG